MNKVVLTVFLGKTTCLDVLAQRKNIGVVSGSMLVDGRPLGGDFARGTAYGTVLCVLFMTDLAYLSISRANGCSRRHCHCP